MCSTWSGSDLARKYLTSLKTLPQTNALSYFAAASIANEKSFKTLNLSLLPNFNH
jgi:hypothetical protein